MENNVAFRGDRAFCSNFFKQEFEFEGEWYATAEHAFQAAKCLNPADKMQIRLASTAREAKYLGRVVQRRPDWDVVRIEIMRRILWAKFSVPALRNLLLATKEPLEERNTWGDCFWGTCAGRGENWLGRLLVELREKLRADVGV